jgi:DNA-binding transcriptional ArsR family regulator
VVAWGHRLDRAEHVGELRAAEALGGGDPFDSGAPDVEHWISIEEVVDDGVAVVARQSVELAGDGGELASGGLELLLARTRSIDMTYPLYKDGVMQVPVSTLTLLADPTRATVVDSLARGDLTVGELVDIAGVSQPAMSRHLRILREGGLVRSRPDKQRRLYALIPEPLDQVDEWLGNLRSSWAKRLNDLERVLENDDDSRNT